MKAYVVLSILIAGSGLLARAEPQPQVQTKKDRISYSLGAYIGEYWKRQGLEPQDVDWNLVVNGFHAELYDGPRLMDQKGVREGIRLLSSDLLNRHYEHQHELAIKNRKEGNIFLEQNKAKPGVHTLPSGLQYEVIKEGSGASPTTNDLVLVNYVAKFIDGTVLDDSSKFTPRNPPMPITGTKGWVEALQLMKPGAKWHVVIPPDLAHGELGSYPRIPPNATLVYDVELLSVERGAAKNQQANPSIQAGAGDIIKVPSAEDLQKGAQIEVIKPPEPAQK